MRRIGRPCFLTNDLK